MKSSILCRKHKAGFTLVELLVVLGIIAILVGVLVASAGSVIKMAKRTKSSSIAVQLQTAVMNYYTEYGLYPVPAGAAGDAYLDNGNVAAWQALTWALCGNINPYDGTKQNPAIPNTRGIAYLSPARSDLGANGILKNPFTTATAATYYFLAMDSDYSGILGDSTPAQGNLVDFTKSTKTAINKTAQLATGVAVWCNNDQPVAGVSNSTFWSHTY